MTSDKSPFPSDTDPKFQTGKVFGLSACHFIHDIYTIIVLTPAATAIPMSLIGLAPNYGVLLLLLFVTGVSMAIFHVPMPVMVARLSGPSIGKGMSS